MIRHIVMWKLKAKALGVDKETNRKRLISELKSLKEKIAVLCELHVGSNCVGEGDARCDVCLETSFKSLNDLEAYQKHPEHQKIVSFVGDIVSERRVVDFNDTES